MSRVIFWLFIYHNFHVEMLSPKVVHKKNKIINVIEMTHVHAICHRGENYCLRNTCPKPLWIHETKLCSSLDLGHKIHTLSKLCGRIPQALCSQQLFQGTSFWSSKSTGYLVKSSLNIAFVSTAIYFYPFLVIHLLSIPNIYSSLTFIICFVNISRKEL